MLACLYPELKSPRDYIVFDPLDGEGARLIAWDAEGVPQPTVEDLEARMEEYNTIKSDKDRIRNRVSEYPAIGDQLDMLWHDMDEGVIPKSNRFYDAIKAVKDKYPKGT